jgi:hypothetical protein
MSGTNGMVTPPRLPPKRRHPYPGAVPPYAG